MRAAVLHQAPGDLVIEDLDIARPVGREVLIRTKASGLCHSDLHVIEGLLPLPSLPAVLGHEASGIVEAVGPDVTAFAPGDHVITCLTQFCGTCTECHAGRIYVCPNRHGLVRGADEDPTLSLGGRPVLPMTGLGAFAEQMLVHENGVVGVDPDVPFDVAALIGCAVLTGVGSAVNGARIAAGETVAVIGCGGIGLNIVQGCRLAGAGRIIAVDLNADKLEAARGFGATDVVDASQADPVEAVLAMTGGLDAAFEAIGLTATAEQALAMVAPGRTAYLVGVPPVDSAMTVSGAMMVLQAKSLRGLFMGNSHFKVDMPRLARHYLEGRLELDRLVSAHITLDEVNDGYAELKAGATLRSVIVFD
ncbi:MAG: Zn-dependent alcohol dehydrogenase [Actinomycetota bacterium]|nr:Zn-dependent alcohol dehydrogenase [Actinomycetota bacterium]MEC9395191.1 Zn-dependent alcohol dehydrogenase [Actinomycetota bacterium]MEE2957395.1 Zn-dependent alcohol dehydrogenase [Actinomycetota bacterium]